MPPHHNSRLQHTHTKACNARWNEALCCSLSLSLLYTLPLSLYAYPLILFSNRIRTWLRRIKYPTLNIIIVAVLVCMCEHIDTVGLLYVFVFICLCVCTVHGTQTTFSYSSVSARHIRSFGFVAIRLFEVQTQHEQHQVTIKDHSTYSNCFIQCWYLVCRSERSSRISSFLFLVYLKTDTKQHTSKKWNVQYCMGVFFFIRLYSFRPKWQWQISVCAQHILIYNIQFTK